MKTTRGLLLFVFGVQLFLCRGLLLGELPWRRDLSRLFVPLKHYLSAALHDGWFPQWWPFDGLGMPLASQPMASLFHPTTALFAVLPFGAAFALQFFLPLPFALLGTYRLGRALGLRPWSATLAGAVYSLSGYFLSTTEFTFSSLAAAALPFVAWGAADRRAGVLAISMALLLLAGDPVLACLALGTAFAFAVHNGPARRWVPFGAALAWAGLAGAIQWLPTALLYFESSRSHGTVHGSTFWAMGSEQLRGLVLPGNHQGPGHLLGSTYLGVLTLGLALVGAATRGRKRLALLLLAALSLGLSVGELLPLWKTFAAVVPGWSAFRFPAKAIAPFVLGVAVLAGRGGQRLLRRRLGPSMILLAVVTLELAGVNGFLVQTAPAWWRAPPPLAVTLGALGVSLEGATYAWRWAPPSPPRQRLEDDALQLATLAPSSAALHGLPSSNAYLPGYSAEYGELALREQWTWLGKLSGLFGTRYLVVPHSEEKIVARDEHAPAVVVELPDALPRAYLTPGVQWFSRALVPAYLRSPHFQPGREVVLQGEGTPTPPGDLVPAVVHRTGDSVEVTAVAVQRSVLVLNEALFSGVHAFEGDQELPVLRANHLVRGVILGPGTHTVRFTFQTPGLKLGALLSILASLLGVLAFTFSRRPRADPLSPAAPAAAPSAPPR